MSMAGQRVTIPEGSVLVIMCDVAGSPEPTIMWFVNGVETTEGAMGNNYTITDARQGDVGSYECRVMSVAGTDSLTTQVTVVGKCEENEITIILLLDIRTYVCITQQK